MSVMAQNPDLLGVYYVESERGSDIGHSSESSV